MPLPIEASEDSDEALLKDAVNKLKKVFVAYYPGLPVSQQKLFKKFDKSGDGVLSRDEFLDGLDSFDNKIDLTER